MSESGRLGWLNGLPGAEARRELLTCCTSERWTDGVAAGRPYLSMIALLDSSNKVVADLAVDDLRAALHGHPRIGDRAGAGHDDRDWSRREQAGVTTSDEAVQQGLAEGNAAYERRFGHIYLVCAAGRSGAELLAVLRDRLGNDPDTEWAVVRAELSKINALRLARLLGA
jgi:2-oxo-4-hydroxy-4-carboxy-5-ureidoimidazoline decarboxylase